MLVLIFEVIGFFIIVGVDLMVGFYVLFCIVIIIFIFGGRSGMILVVIGLMVVVMVLLVVDYGF